jgi:hypothetical protein
MVGFSLPCTESNCRNVGTCIERVDLHCDDRCKEEEFEESRTKRRRGGDSGNLSRNALFDLYSADRNTGTDHVICIRARCSDQTFNISTGITAPYVSSKLSFDAHGAFIHNRYWHCIFSSDPNDDLYMPFCIVSSFFKASTMTPFNSLCIST